MQPMPLNLQAARLGGATCRVCQQPGSLEIRKIHRFSTPVVVIGWLILIPTFLGMSCGTIGLVGAGGMAAQSAQSGGPTVGAYAGGLSLFVLISSFMGGLLGYLLIMKKKVITCGRCGSVQAEAL